MDGEVKVSVVCPVYNHENYIRKALDSILMQKTNFIFEILVGNDCSTDRTKSILDEYEQKEISNLAIWNRKKNMGATKNSYDLYSRACGKYVVMLETDDYFTDENKLQIQYDFLENHIEFSGVAHDFCVINKKGDIVSESGVKRCGAECFFNSSVWFKDFMKYGFFFHTSTKMHLNFMHFGDNYKNLLLTHPLVGDLTINSILLDRGPIYLMRDVMSAYREVVDCNAQNARSIAKKTPKESCINCANLYRVLTVFFQGRFDYSKMEINNLNNYLIHMLKRRQGFNLEGYRYCIKQCGKGVWIRSIGWLVHDWIRAKIIFIGKRLLA